jgi:hypothetical protein
MGTSPSGIRRIRGASVLILVPAFDPIVAGDINRVRNVSGNVTIRSL